MKVELKENSCVVTRDNNEKFYRETTLMHHVKKELIRQGHDVIKKRMWKDGHLVDEQQEYIRTRNKDERKGEVWCLFFEQYALRRMYEDYNNGELILTRAYI